MSTSTKPEWRSTNVQGLYEYRPTGLAESKRGVYYSRYSVNGKRTFRSLETSVFEHAKVKHAQRGVDVEKDRQRGADLGTQFKTLGALYGEMEARFATTDVSPSTVTGRRNNMKRLRAHWQRGTFDTFLARNVTAEVVVELREHLLHSALWSYHFGKPKRGFRQDVVNQALWVLRVMLDIAVEKMVVMENPFSTKTALRNRLFVGGRGTGRQKHQPMIPSRPDMLRILAEMRRVPEEGEGFATTPEYRRYLENVANEKADHAELLAFSGMRRSEATAAVLADDLGEELKIRGTKSVTSERTVPVNESLRAVLDRIKSRRVGPKTKLLVTEDIRGALRRACDRLGLPPIRIHDLRHFFASACIASGVDVPTVSRWLGHADGGALAMETYGHLLKDHSLAAAKKVDFSGAKLRSA